MSSEIPVHSDGPGAKQTLTVSQEVHSVPLNAQTQLTKLMQTFEDSTEQSLWFLQGFSNASHTTSFTQVSKT